MSVPVRGSIRFDKAGRWLEEVSRRLIALEKDSGGAASVPTFASPATPAFGSGSSGAGGGGSSGGGTSGVTDHGALTGLLDDDHPQYADEGAAAPPLPHVHSPDDVLLLEHRFYRRGESAQALPHGHTAEALGFDERFYRRGERASAQAHNHTVSDVSDLRPNDEQFVLASRIFGG